MEETWNVRTYKHIMATKSQIKRIHMLKSRLCIDESTYREMLSSYGVSSSKDLTWQQADKLLKTLEDDAVALDLWKKKPLKFEDCANREDMATPSQIRLIMGLWREDSNLDDKTSQEKLWIFLDTHFKISDVKFLTKTKANSVIHAIRKIKENYKNKSVAAQM